MPHWPRAVTARGDAILNETDRKHSLKEAYDGCVEDVKKKGERKPSSKYPGTHYYTWKVKGKQGGRATEEDRTMYGRILDDEPREFKYNTGKHPGVDEDGRPVVDAFRTRSDRRRRELFIQVDVGFGRGEVSNRELRESVSDVWGNVWEPELKAARRRGVG